MSEMTYKCCYNVIKNYERIPCFSSRNSHASGYIFKVLSISSKEPSKSCRYARHWAFIRRAL